MDVILSRLCTFICNVTIYVNIVYSYFSSNSKHLWPLLVTVTQLVSQLNLEAAQIADDRVDELQAEADQRIRIAETTMEKRLQDTALLEHRATTAEATVAEQRKALTLKDEKLVQIETDLQASRESVATLTPSLEDTTRQLATKTRQVDGLEQTLEQIRTKNKTTMDQVQTELDSVRQALSESQTALAITTEQCAGLSTRLEERNQLIDAQEPTRGLERTVGEEKTLALTTTRWEAHSR